MTRSSSLGITALLGVSLFTGSAAAAGSMETLIADRPTYAVGLGFDYATGDYGTGNQSDFISVPFYLDFYPTDRVDIEIVVPYLYQHTDEDGTTIFYRSPGGYAGVAASQSHSGQNSMGSGTNDPISPGDNGTRDSLATSETVETDSRRVSANGLGDVTLTIGYAVIEESPSTPLVRPTLYLKIPTADEDKGLGSGEFDFGPGLTLGKWFDNWYLLAEGLYVIQGETSLYDTKNYLSYDVSVGRRIGESLFLSTMVQGLTPPLQGAGDLIEGQIKGVWSMTPDVSLEGYVGTGLSEDSADFTSSIAVFFSF